MKTIDLDELKSIQLKMMDDIHSFCMSNKIRYFLSYGTLIGAIRHNGYIPWDDDIDIVMPRPDYERFLQTFNQQNSPYKMICMENNIDYGLPFGKVHDTRTEMHETLYMKEYYGVYIDIFPLDGCDKEGSLIHKSNNLRKLLNAKKAIINTNRNFLKNLVLVCGKLCLVFSTKRSILNRFQKLCHTYPYETSEYVANIADSFYGEGEIMNKAITERLVLHTFENYNFYIPQEYDKILNQLYGDYMQLPPIEKRKSTHTFEAWWKE